MADESIGGGNGRRLQLRPMPEKSWTAANRRVFLDHLATSCNVRAAARAVGMSDAGAYALRRRDPEFAAQWQAAVQLGYETIEAMLLARVISGADGTLPERQEGDPVPPSPETMDKELAMSLMRRHQEGGGVAGKRGGHRPRCASKAELVAALNERIGKVKRGRGDKE